MKSIEMIIGVGAGEIDLGLMITDSGVGEGIKRGEEYDGLDEMPDI